jgi:hypothetical protein
MTATIIRGTLSRLTGGLVEQQREAAPDPKIFGEKFGLAAALFGCWHENLSRPFGQGEKLYRSCLKCGARTPFNTETFETDGRFYYPPEVVH